MKGLMNLYFNGQIMSKSSLEVPLYFSFVSLLMLKALWVNDINNLGLY